MKRFAAFPFSLSLSRVRADRCNCVSEFRKLSKTVSSSYPAPHTRAPIDDFRFRFFVELASIPFTSLLKAQKQLSKSTAHASRKGKGRATASGSEEEEEEEGEGRGNGKKGKNQKEKFGKKRDSEGRSNKHA